LTATFANTYFIDESQLPGKTMHAVRQYHEIGGKTTDQGEYDLV
jgi:hypothetical protein